MGVRDDDSYVRRVVRADCLQEVQPRGSAAPPDGSYKKAPEPVSAPVPKCNISTTASTYFLEPEASPSFLAIATFSDEVICMKKKGAVRYSEKR